MTRGRNLLTAGFWVALAFGALCVAAGAGVALYGASNRPPPAFGAAEPAKR
jgi:hypothetical protein